MTVSIKEHFKFAGTQEEIELKRVFGAVLTDLDNQNRDMIALLAKLSVDHSAQNVVINGITAKLDADVGINDTDYAATWVAALDTNYTAIISVADLNLTA